MEKLWMTINGCRLKKSVKGLAFLSMLIVICIMTGALLWASIGRIFLPETSWMLCFMGYPAVLIGFFGGILYLYNHDFEELD